jgi:hypothetical protein
MACRPRHLTRGRYAQALAYRTLLRKFWFAAGVGLPLVLLMFAEFVPA